MTSDVTPAPGMIAALLRIAHAEQARIVVTLRGDPTRGRPERHVEGVAVEFHPTADGRERVLMEVVKGQTLQVLLIDAIIAVDRIGPPAARGATLAALRLRSISPVPAAGVAAPVPETQGTSSVAHSD